MTAAEFIAELEKLDPDTVVLTGNYDPYRGGYTYLEDPTIQARIFIDTSRGYVEDVTYAERERDIPAVVIS